MTELYDWNPMPHRVRVRCPRCDSAAEFEFAEVVMIKLARDIEYFKKSDAFEYGFFQDRDGRRWHGAIYYHGLKGSTLGSIEILPEGYAPEDWKHGQYLYRSHRRDIGAIVCSFCDYRRKHDLKWPEEAFFQIEHRGKVLWAFDRESATELLEYVYSEDRNRKKFKWQSFLLHIPNHFLQKSAREALARNLKRLLLNPDLHPQNTSG